MNLTPQRTQVLPPHMIPPAQMIDESERLRYFQQSANTTGGAVPPYRSEK
jgi:hypothetical protein